jgi:hypothetical protein
VGLVFALLGFEKKAVPLRRSAAHSMRKRRRSDSRVAGAPPPEALAREAKSDQDQVVDFPGFCLWKTGDKQERSGGSANGFRPANYQPSLHLVQSPGARLIGAS